ncbi:type II toxin-antitoxin system Phd/YefM family antitoxin [Staphylococcus felis]
MSEADYNAIMETLYLLQSLANARHLSQSSTEIESENTVKVDIYFRK